MLLQRGGVTSGDLFLFLSFKKKKNVKVSPRSLSVINTSLGSFYYTYSK